jgi:hypothetical protein
MWSESQCSLNSENEFWQNFSISRLIWTKLGKFYADMFMAYSAFLENQCK